MHKMRNHHHRRRHHHHHRDYGHKAAKLKLLANWLTYLCRTITPTARKHPAIFISFYIIFLPSFPCFFETTAAGLFVV